MVTTMSNFSYLLNLQKSIDPFISTKIKKIELKNIKKKAKELIDKEIFEEGLSNLGITFNGYNYAYLNLDISKRDLISIGGISDFRFLQNIDLSHNNLTTLEPLNGLKHINILNASHNKITDIFDFDPPSKLEIVDYSHNDITQIDNAKKNKYLKKLNLSYNKITTIEKLSENLMLFEINLSFNYIEFINNLDNLNINRLNLCGNKLKDLSGLEKLNKLTHLYLSRNNISKLKGLRNLVNLRVLNLSSNKVSRTKQIGYVLEIPYLTDINLCFNDVQKRKFYRLNLIWRLPQLKILDGQEIDHFEKVKADIVFGEDLEKRKDIFKNYLPDEEFVDRRLFFEEQIDPESDSDEDLENIDDSKKNKSTIYDNILNSRANTQYIENYNNNNNMLLNTLEEDKKNFTS